MDQETEQRIRHRAYNLWVDADKPEGSHLRFWRQAETEIALEDRTAVVEQPATAPSPSPSPSQPGSIK